MAQMGRWGVNASAAKSCRPPNLRIDRVKQEIIPPGKVVNGGPNTSPNAPEKPCGYEVRGIQTQLDHMTKFLSSLNVRLDSGYDGKWIIGLNI